MAILCFGELLFLLQDKKKKDLSHCKMYFEGWFFLPTLKLSDLMDANFPTVERIFKWLQCSGQYDQ